MKLLIVESPAKEKIINKYLGSGFKVLASYGHIRGLPSKQGSVVPEEDFKIIYEIYDKSMPHINKICDAAKKSEGIFLATDPDREGEAISWHIVEVLKERRVINDNFFVKRVVFNEITKKAINAALTQPRDLDENLIHAQQDRLALDYLVGFTISPILWKKLPGCRSAGRVQSVALRLIFEREEEIVKFVSQEYWSIKFLMFNNNKQEFTSRLIVFEGKKLDKFSITNQNQAQKVVNKLSDRSFRVDKIEKKLQKRNPAPPFITSSLQQEAARKLGFSAKKTMTVAQKLYEGIKIDKDLSALITYMRTDSVTLSEDAVKDIRALIKENFGKDYLPSKARIYKTKTKNAQEAHEAIRPININITPESLIDKIETDFLKLYELIWKRTVACQMENVILDLVSILFISDDNLHTTKTNGSTVKFDGFYKVYQEGIDDVSSDDENEEKKLLPEFKADENVDVKEIIPGQHFTEPAPRYTEASLVKKLEELGIGRPSTYATIISVLQDREYVKLEKKRFIPQDKGKLVTTFLTLFFKKYIEYDFTANLEDQLDEVASGKLEWKLLLRNFWKDFSLAAKAVESYNIADITASIEKLLYHYIFDAQSNDEANICTVCKTGTLGLRLGKFGAFVACSNYPECNYRRNLLLSNSINLKNENNDNNKLLGVNEFNNNIYLKSGPYGWYLEVENQETQNNEKPKRISLPSNYKVEDINLEIALKLTSVPKLVGLHPDTGREIILAIGKYGPYLKYNNNFYKIPKNFDPFTISLDDALKLVNQAVTKSPRKTKKE